MPHHAIDALIIACVPHLSLWKEQKKVFSTDEFRVDETTGEIIEQSYNQLTYQEPFSQFFYQLEKVSIDCRYSYKVDRKFNGQVADATIYSTRQGIVKQTSGDKSFTLDSNSKEHYVIAKIKNIYEDVDAKRFMDRYKKDKTQFLMYHHDPQTFSILEDVMKTYPDKKNPFQAYRLEYGPIRKVSVKKGNGPQIQSIKYYDSKLGQHIELKQANKVLKKVVLQSLNPWRCDIYYNKKDKRYIAAGLKYADLSIEKEQDYMVFHFKDINKF